MHGVLNGGMEQAVGTGARLRVGAEVAQVALHVEENAGGVASEALQAVETHLSVVAAQVEPRHGQSQAVELGTVGNGERAAGSGVGRVECQEIAAQGAVVGRAEQVAAHKLVGDAIHHHFARRSDEAARHTAQLVGHFDARHVAVVKKNVFGVEVGGLHALAQSFNVGLAVACAAAEEARGLIAPVPVEGGPLVCRTRLGKSLDGHPSQAVRTDDHGVGERGGRIGLDIGKDGSETLQRGIAGAAILLELAARALAAVAGNLEHRRPGFRTGQIDYDALALQSFLLLDGLLEIGEVGLETAEQVGAPWHVDKQGAPVFLVAVVIVVTATRREGRQQQSRHHNEEQAEEENGKMHII